MTSMNRQTRLPGAIRMDSRTRPCRLRRLSSMSRMGRNTRLNRLNNRNPGWAITMERSKWRARVAGM